MSHNTKYIQLNAYAADRPLIYFSVENTVLTMLGSEKSDFYLYENLKINKEESMARSHTELSDFDGMEEQPINTFWLSNNIDEISIRKNCGETHLELNSINEFAPAMGLSINDNRVCFDIKNDLKDSLNCMERIGIENVVFKPINSWVYYDAIKTTYTCCDDYIGV